MTENIPQVVEINCETGEETYRFMTAEELAQRETDRIAWQAQQAAIAAEEERVAAAKESAKAKLAALGLTAEEIAAL